MTGDRCYVTGDRRPVVHEDVRFPQGAGRHPDVLEAAVLGLVPDHVSVLPLLGRVCRVQGNVIHLCLK